MVKLLMMIGLLSGFAYAQIDLSGKYNCVGIDSKDGEYSGVVALKLDKNNVTKHAAGYSFSLTEKDAKYNGFAIFDGKSLAVYFANEDTSKSDYGIGVASITDNKKFTKFYYEPKYATTGSTGGEICKKI